MPFTRLLGEWHVTVLGMANVTIRNPEETLQHLRTEMPGTEVQVLRADRIAGQEHLQQAMQHAFKSIKAGEQRSKSIAMETLLYLSGERQISKALDKIGIARDKNRGVVLMIFSKRPIPSSDLEETSKSILNGDVVDSVMDLSTREKAREICNAYGISEREISASQLPKEEMFSVVKRLVLERSALLSIQH